MDDEKIAVWAKRVKATSNSLRQLGVTEIYCSQDHDEAEAIAHAIWDMDESFLKLSQKKFPEFLNRDLTPEQLTELLREVREELKHIVYHIRDCKLFSDVLHE